MKQRILGIIKVVCFLSLLLLCLCGITRLFQRKTSVIKYADFFAQKEDFDVLFFGSSHVVNGIFPMELWEDYGIVSYNCGGHGHQLATTYWHMQNILEYTTPKLIVLDIFGMHYETKYAAAEQLHESFDIMPISETKYRAVQDLFDNPESEDYASRWAYFWDFNVYHSRWNDLKAEDFSYKVNCQKGAEARINVAEPMDYTIIGIDEVYAEDTISQQYLCQIIEDCQERGIEILLTHLPYPAVVEYQQAANMTYKVAEKYDVPYIDFVHMNSVVEYDTDCYDKGSHLNPSGARKVTDYLGEYIMDNYEIPDRRKDEVYKQWHKDYDEYTQWKYEKLNEQTELDDLLMLLRDEELSACIYIAGSSGYLEDGQVHRLLDNAVIEGSLKKLVPATVNKSDYLLVIDRLQEKIWDFDLAQDKDTLDSSMGRVVIDDFSSGDKKIWIDKVNMLEKESADVEVWTKVLVFDASTGEIVSEFERAGERME